MRRSAPTASLAHLLAVAVERNPDGIAVVSESGALTYRELDAASSRLARLLISRGIGPEDRVAPFLTRSLESVLATWAVAKTGAAFVPVDPTYPADRIAYMLNDSGAGLVLTTEEHAGALPGEAPALVLDSAEVRADSAGMSSEPVFFDERRGVVRAENAAYVIYTSGSTGRPKGVVVTHSGLANFCAEQVERYGLSPQSRTLHFASPSSTPPCWNSCWRWVRRRRWSSPR